VGVGKGVRSRDRGIGITGNRIKATSLTSPGAILKMVTCHASSRYDSLNVIGFEPHALVSEDAAGVAVDKIMVVRKFDCMTALMQFCKGAYSRKGMTDTVIKYDNQVRRNNEVESWYCWEERRLDEGRKLLNTGKRSPCHKSSMEAPQSHRGQVDQDRQMTSRVLSSSREVQRQKFEHRISVLLTVWAEKVLSIKHRQPAQCMIWRTEFCAAR
jgi:hypothetical protein